MKSPQHVVAVFAKEPRPGEVKTRLAQETSPQLASEVAQACLEDTLLRLVAVPARRLLVYAPRSAQHFFASLAADRFELRPQGDGDLGQRMEAFFRQCLADENSRVVVVGADSPTMPVGFVIQAFDLLETNDVVLGPAMDGGYYLLGCARRVPPIFSGIAWGGADVLAQTVQRLSDPAWRVALLPPWYDVDTLADWRMLCGHIQAMRRAGVDPRTPAIEKLVDPPE
jgi:uncharacterized protein